MSSLPEPSVARCRVCHATLRDAGSIAAGVCPEHGPTARSMGDPAAVPGTVGPGTVLGKCKVVRELGSGGMGTVYLARHRMLDMYVAVKVLSPEVARLSPAAAERFLREARLAARIKHPNVVAVTDADHDLALGISYIVMELVDGPSAGALVARGALEPYQAVRIALGVANALEAAAAHHVVHRDVKPSNVLIDADGTVKLTDLGLAKDTDFEGKLTASAATLGTPLYMSPEQVKRSRELDSRTDIYSLGVTLFEMLTGTVPYDGLSFYEVAEQITGSPVPDPCDRKRGLDPALGRLVMRMMAKEREDRPATPTEALKLLCSWLGEDVPDGAAVRVPQLARAGKIAPDEMAYEDTLHGPGAEHPQVHRTGEPEEPAARVSAPAAPPAISQARPADAPGWTYRGFILCGALICGLTACAVMLVMHLFLRPPPPPHMRHGPHGEHPYPPPPPPWGYGPPPGAEAPAPPAPPSSPPR